MFNFQKEYDKKSSIQDIIKESVDYLIKTYNFATLKDTDKIYYYDVNRGIYVNGGEVFIKGELAAMHTYISTNQVTEIINNIKYKTYIDREEFDSKVEWLACKDCMVNLFTGETKPHSPEFMATMQIPVTYQGTSNPSTNHFTKNAIDITCPKIMKFLYEIFSDKRDVETILDFMAYCLWPEMKFHKFLILKAEGRNGKGTLCKLITKFLGRDNVASESIDQLLGGRFSSSQLNRKLVNIDADVSKEISKKTGILKKLTGNDMISAEEKYKSPFTFVNYAKLILVCNELPEIKEDTIAIFSRLVIIDFSKTFIKNANPNLIDELTTEEELSGLLHIVLKRLPRVLKSGISYTKSIENLEQYQLRMNPVKYFVDNYLEKVPESKVKKEIVYKKYKEFCYGNKIPPKSEYKLSQELVGMRYEYKQVRDGGGATYRSYYWLNLRMKE